MKKTVSMNRFEDILRILEREKNWPVARLEEGRWEITVPSMDGLKQAVFATRTTDCEGDAVVTIWSIVCPRSEVKDMAKLLEANFRLVYGAFAFTDDDVILTHAHLVRDADVKELAKSIEYIGQQSRKLYSEIFEN